MKICSHCQTQNFDINEVCSKCKQPLTVKSTFSAPQVTAIYQQTTRPNNSVTRKESDLSVAAKVFMIITCASLGLSLIGAVVFWIVMLILAQKTPSLETSILVITSFMYVAVFFIGECVSFAMTKSYFTKISKKRPIGTAFKICMLLFVNLVAGILLLCDKGNGYQEVFSDPAQTSNPQTSNMQTPNTQTPKQPQNVAKELKGYKELLDCGIITQEEFEEKKKELL